MTKEGKIRNGIYKRGDSYYIHVKVNGTRIRKSFGPDRRAAELALAEIKRERALLRVTQDFSGLEKLLTPKSTVTFAEAYQTYIEQREFKSSSLLSYEDRSKHILPEFGDRLISEVTEEHIARFQTRLRSINKLSANRTNSIVGLLRAVLKMCHRRHLIETNPADGVEQVRAEETDVDPLTQEELELVLSKLTPRYQSFFTVCAWTGARPGELKALRWRDIDFVRKEIKIDKARYKSEESTAKTKSSKRVIPMLAPVLATLRHLEQSQTVIDLNGHVFVGPNGEPINRGLDQIWAKALRKAGLRHRPSYQLRHTFASLCLQSGVTPGWVSKVLGHSTLQTTFRHYARYIDKHQKADLRFVESLFQKSAASNNEGPQKGPQGDYAPLLARAQQE